MRINTIRYNLGGVTDLSCRCRLHIVVLEIPGMSTAYYSFNNFLGDIYRH